ncbi:MAG: hypothetical protein K8J31_29855, partial [Anaerolineae bacterium]|nr:hypothetical protein [Anaerolineae bacterium]
MCVNVYEIQEHIDDHTWLDARINCLHEHIETGIRSNTTAVESIQLLNTIMPYALTRTDYRRWEPLLLDALLHAMDLKDEESQIQIWAHLGSSYLQSGRVRTAAEAFRKSLARITQDATPETKLLARIGMLRAQAVTQASDIQQFIEETLTEARCVVNYHLRGRLHFAVGMIYTHMGQTQQALGHAQIALACWHQLHNSKEFERSALLLTEACRIAMCYQQAARYQELVHPGTEDLYKQAVYHYQRGAILLEQDQLRAAGSEFQRALANYQMLDFPYLTGATYHALGLVQTKLNDFKGARDSLRYALTIWQEMENQFQQ